TQLFKDGIKIAGDDGDDVTVDLYTTALGDIEKTLWMIEAEVG
ncbi:MAG: ferritin-like domain-containing protein, partial [Lactococcus lactis]